MKATWRSCVAGLAALTVLGLAAPALAAPASPARPASLADPVARAGIVPIPVHFPPVSAVYGSSAIAWTGNSVIITAVDSQGNLDCWWQAAGTTPWHQEVVAAA